jgi:hypothetical protein
MPPTSATSPHHERVGAVGFRFLAPNQAERTVYSDGAIERLLHYTFTNGNHAEDGQPNATYYSWAHEYHLSPVRHNLLLWYPFSPNATAIEIGAGCGAMTGLLCDRLAHVTALEYSAQRGHILALRHSHRRNLDVLVGGIQDLTGAHSHFEYAVVIGVLEYAGTYFDAPDPYHGFLQKVRDLLTPDGVLLLAIENRLGLKYLAGAPEDHTGNPFDSIYGYCSASGVRTFSRHELGSLLRSSGFSHCEWYYPLPDYKMPCTVLSDDATPGLTDPIWSLLPATCGNVPRRQVLCERLLGKTIRDANLFGEFANSFLVAAHVSSRAPRPACARFDGACQARRPEYRTYHMISQSDDGTHFVKRPATDAARDFLNTILHREHAAQRFFEPHADVAVGALSNGELRYTYHAAPTLAECVAIHLRAGRVVEADALVAAYVRFVRSLPSKESSYPEFTKLCGVSTRALAQPERSLVCAPLDCIPRNILVRAGKWLVCDHEWFYDFPVPADFIVYRGIMSLVGDAQDEIQWSACAAHPVVLFSGYGARRRYIPLAWYEWLRACQRPIKCYVRWEAGFQQRITSNARSGHLRIRRRLRQVTHLRLGMVARCEELARLAGHRLTRFRQKVRVLLAVRDLERRGQHVDGWALPPEGRP